MVAKIIVAACEDVAMRRILIEAEHQLTVSSAAEPHIESNQRSVAFHQKPTEVHLDEVDLECSPTL